MEEPLGPGASLSHAYRTVTDPSDRRRTVTDPSDRRTVTFCHPRRPPGPQCPARPLSFGCMSTVHLLCLVAKAMLQHESPRKSM